MSSRARVWIVVGLAAVAAAGTVVGVTLATRNNVQHQASKPPPFAADPTARPEVAQQVRDALKAWPAGTARRLRILAARYPHSALVQLELGLALALSGQQADATRAWQAAERVQPDSPSAVRAQDLRHPGGAPGLPPFVPSFTKVMNVVRAHLLRGSAYQQWHVDAVLLSATNRYTVFPALSTRIWPSLASVAAMIVWPGAAAGLDAGVGLEAVADGVDPPQAARITAIKTVAAVTKIFGCIGCS